LLRRGLRDIQRFDDWSEQPNQAFPLEELQATIVSLAGELRIPPQHEAAGRVRILSAESARKLSTQHLFLTGLSEQAFSSSGTTEIDIADNSSEGPAELPENLVQAHEPQLQRSDAMLLFYELATRPTASLTLSYPALDAKGQPLLPSPLLTDWERSYGPGRIRHETQSWGHEASTAKTPLSVGSFRRQAVAQALDGNQRWLAGMVSRPNLVRTGSSILNGVDCIARRGTRDSYGPHEGLLLSKSAKSTLSRRFDSRHLWSPSQLESYATCPFRFFAEQMLGLEPLNELTLSTDARRRGSLLHQVLATLHEQLLAEDASDVDSEELVRRFREGLNAAVAAAPLRGIEQALREIERREIEAFAPDYAAQETNYRNQWKHLDQPPRPALFEVRFGPETRRSAAETSDQASTAVPFELDLGAEKICLTGQIDRVDVGQAGGVTVFNIIDYKTGQEVRLKQEKVRSGHQLQLPLYALAAEQLLLAEQDAVALATGYWNIRSKGFGSKKGGALAVRELVEDELQISEAWQQMQPDILSRVHQLINGVRGGQFPVYNEDQQCTRGCSLNTVCRVAQIRSLEKVWPPEVLPDEGGGDGD
ncbi:MAG: PD-(D/E)XK nuclease family protein, partial [Bythopirellula sp.]